MSLALQLRMVRATVSPDLPELAAGLDRLVARLGEARDELREFAHGVHPAILADGGLAPALKALARRSAIPVELDVRVQRRLPQALEVCAYYAVAEGLANAAKHSGAPVAAVEVQAPPDALRVVVRDAGVGGADATRGSGLTALTDRVEALGGRIAIRSAPGAGTTLSVELPLAGAAGRRHSRLASP